MKAKPLLLGLMIGIACVAHASVFHDDEAHCIRVVDFPKDTPCTLQRLLQMDRLYAWGKVVHDPEQDRDVRGFPIRGEAHTAAVQPGASIVRDAEGEPESGVLTGRQRPPRPAV